MELHEAIRARTERAIAEQVFPGCSIGIVRPREEKEVLTFGTLTYESPTSVDARTVYDVASVTKSIPVASLMLELIASGRCKLSDTATRYLPELQNDYDATLGDLLTYRVHGTRLSELADMEPDALVATVLERGFDAAPGESVYTNLPAFLLGLILERVAEDDLEHLARSRYFEELGMRDTTYFPLPQAHCAPTEVVGEQELRGLVQDESARVFALAHRCAGHAGLFSTAPDLLAFMEALVARALPAILDGAKKGLGWQRAEPWFMGAHCSPESFGKTGFAGASVAADPKQGKALVILSNRTYPHRPPDAASLTSAINLFRRDIADIVFS